MDAAEASTDASGLGESFLATGGQYVVEDPSFSGQDQEDALDDEQGSDEAMREQLSFQDRFLPIANVARIMKKSIPKMGKIAKDAKECVQECVSEFISFITSEASERCHQEKRKTINGEDILFAMSTLGFDSYVEPLKIYLQKYRESTKSDKSLTPGHVSETGGLDELGADDSFANLITTDASGQQNVIYTAAYPSQITTQQLNFG